MGTFSIWHWLIVLAVVLVLFGGGGKIPKLMRDMGQGINAFKKGLKEEDKGKGRTETEAEADAGKSIDNEPAAAAASRIEEKDKAASG
ncbi:MAG: twin-arginine translocase TatA/TatE family subunit [Kiloniellaceae bacterium]